MRFSLRIFLGFFFILGLMALVVFDVLRDEVRPAMRQAAEDVLVDMSQLLAEVARDDLRAGRIADGSLARAAANLAGRDPQAHIWGIDKRRAQLRVYVTDAGGRVVYASTPALLGQDYSRWRDVFLTLHGQYGARTTRDNESDPTSSWMYVAAPVTDAAGKIIGVVTVGKPGIAIEPYMMRAESRLLHGALAVFLASLLLGALFSWWLSRGIRRLTDYALAVRDDVRMAPPRFPANRELSELARALEEMRASLDGKEYIEEYVLGLTHELKSPLTGIRGSAELLQDELSPADRARFAGHVCDEADRLREIVDRLLELVRIEQRLTPIAPERIAVASLLQSVTAALAPQAQRDQVRLHVDGVADIHVSGERFLLEQAVRNLVQNAIDFSAPDSAVALSARVEGGNAIVRVTNAGDAIPDFALPRLFERFFSLPRPRNGRKGSGLGLPLVRTIARLHGGDVALINIPGGVVAELVLPAA